MGRVIVVGAGVAGLSAAFRLTQHGHDVTVLESEPQVGGKTAASRRDGFVLNKGAVVIGGSYDALLALAREAGVESELTAQPATTGVFGDGRVHRFRDAPPGAIVDVVRTPLLSWKSKLLLGRMARDVVGAKRTGYDDPDLRARLDAETIAEYCERRLTPEICDALLAPIVGGIHVTDGASLSVLHLHNTLTKTLAGGILRYRAGVDFFARALADRLDVSTSSRVTRVERDATSARVVWSGEDGEVQQATVDGVILGIAAPCVPDLYPGLDPKVQQLLLEGVPQANSISVRFALSQRPDERALTIAVPRGELGGLAMVMQEHLIAPECAPPGKGVVGVLLHHEWVTPRLESSDERLVEELLPHLERVVPGISETIEFWEVTRWTPAGIRCEPGAFGTIAEIVDGIGPGERVQLAGDYLGPPSINGSVVTGERAAARLTAVLDT